MVFQQDNKTTRQQENKDLKKNKTALNDLTIDSIESIELFEKMNGCFFGFIGAWNDKKVYSAKEFLIQFPDTSKDWKSKVIAGAESEKQKCKEQKQVALSYTDRFHYNHSNFK